MKKHLERLFKLRFTFPLLIACALSLSLISEITYRRSVSTLTAGIALTEARIGSARILQLLTDAETAQRGYLLTGMASDLEPMRAARRELDGNNAIFRFIESIGPTGADDARGIRAGVAAKLLEMENTVSLAIAGDRDAALDAVKTGAGRRAMDDVRTAFEAKLTEATLLQKNARGKIYNALWLNRTLVTALSWLVAIGLYLQMRQLRRRDDERGERQQLLETEVTERTRDLRSLAGYLQTAREDEKSRLARELHDELGGLLTAARLTLARMRDKLAGDKEMTERIGQINQHLGQGIALKRRMVEDLRPSTLAALGLQVALSILCSETAERLGIPVHADIAEVADIANLQLAPEAELAIFRVAQEALTNIAKHADATEVRVRMQPGTGELLLEVSDNGRGFDLARLEGGSHGLAGMRFRMESLRGRMSVLSEPGNGTRVVARLPLAFTPQAPEPA